MTEQGRMYPRQALCDGSSIELRRMVASDAEGVLAFANRLPAHDLLFMRRDLRQPKVLAAWLRAVANDRMASLVALRDGMVVGTTAIVHDKLSWSPHVGELRIAVLPEERGRGVGRLLIQECFAMALDIGLEKLTALMTVDQKGAIAVFESLGFRPEAMLRGFVKDSGGDVHDIVVLSHDVAQSQARSNAYGAAQS